MRREYIQTMHAMQIIKYSTCLRKTISILCIYYAIFPFARWGYAMQPPPPPLDIARFQTLITEANIVVVGTVNEVKETEGVIEATVDIEELLKGKVAGKTVKIMETYKDINSPKPSLELKDKDGSNKVIARAIAGPRTYRGKYEKGLRIIVLMEKIEGAERYRPLGSGTYNKHLCEFFIENDGIKTVYFHFAEDVKKHTMSKKQFIDLINKLVKVNPDK